MGWKRPVVIEFIRWQRAGVGRDQERVCVRFAGPPKLRSDSVCSEYSFRAWPARNPHRDRVVGRFSAAVGTEPSYGRLTQTVKSTIHLIMQLPMCAALYTRLHSLYPLRVCSALQLSMFVWTS
jgi:hypothetical protein